MSGCKVCNVPLRVGYRSGNNIDVGRIRGGHMVCYGCDPHILPIRNINPYTPIDDLTRREKVLRGLIMSLGEIKSLKRKCRKGIQLLQVLKHRNKVHINSTKVNRTSGEIYCYVYGLLNKHKEVRYIGRSFKPRQRCLSHGVDYIKIIDKFIDVEQKWINKYIDDGIILENKENPQECEIHNVGDIVKISKFVNPVLGKGIPV